MAIDRQRRGRRIGAAGALVVLAAVSLMGLGPGCGSGGGEAASLCTSACENAIATSCSKSCDCSKCSSAPASCDDPGLQCAASATSCSAMNACPQAPADCLTFLMTVCQ